MKKILTALVVAGVALVSVAGCATETGVGEPTEGPDESMPKLAIEEGTITPEARQDGSCCNVLCTRGRRAINLPLQSGCTEWAQWECRNAWAPAERFVDAWWGACHF